MYTEGYCIVLQTFVGCWRVGVGGDLGHEVVDVACLLQMASEMRLWGHLKGLIAEPLWEREDLVAS